MTGNVKGRIVSIGEPMIEFNQVKAGEPGFVRGFGGDTSNCIIAAARQGVATAYVSAVGNDAFGELLLALWRAEGVDTCHVTIDSQAPTGVYFVTHDARGHQFSYLRAGSAASRMSAQTVTREMLAGASFLHVSGITQAISASACDASFAAMDLARELGVPVAYDPNLRLRLWPLARARAIIRDSIARAEITLVSVDDAAVLPGESSPDKMLETLLAWDARMVLLKLGAGGVTLHHEGRSITIAGHAVNCVDATGAGDCFAGAFLARLVQGDEPREAARYANAAAALSTRGFGAIAPIPRAEEVFKFLS